MSNAEQYWIWQQLEPTDTLTAGNYKRYKPVPVVVLVSQPIVDREEDERRQDEFLLKFGVQ